MTNLLCKNTRENNNRFWSWLFLPFRMRSTKLDGNSDALDSATVPNEYFHRLDYSRAVLAWSALTIYTLWNLTKVESLDEGRINKVNADDGLERILSIITCLGFIMCATVIAVRRLSDPSLPKNFLVNQLHISMFPSPLLVYLSLAAVSLLSTVLANVVVGTMYFRKIQQEQLEQGNDSRDDFIQIVFQYVLKGVPNVSKFVTRLTNTVLATPFSELAKWFLVRRYHTANTLPFNVLARRTVTLHGMVSLALISAVGWALPNTLKILTTSPPLVQNVENFPAIINFGLTILLSVWHVFKHAVSTTYVAVTVYGHRENLSVWNLLKAGLVSCFMHAISLLGDNSDENSLFFMKPSLVPRFVLAQFVFYVLPVLLVATLARFQYVSLRDQQQQGSIKDDWRHMASESRIPLHALWTTDWQRFRNNTSIKRMEIGNISSFNFANYSSGTNEVKGALIHHPPRHLRV